MKRITRFIERKSPKIIKPVLSISVLQQTTTEPFPPKFLSLHQLPRISIPTIQRPQSYRKFQPVESLPGSRCEDKMLFSSYIDGPTQTTVFACCFCHDDFSFKLVEMMRSHIYAAHRTEMYNKLITPGQSSPPPYFNGFPSAK